MLIKCYLNEVKLGYFVTISNGVRMQNSSIGDFSYVAHSARLSNVSIGRFCSIGPSIHIGLSSHPTREFVSTHPSFYTKEHPACAYQIIEHSIYDDSIPKTLLGHDVWIGANAIIPGGVRIGTGAIIAAGSVVVKDIPPYAIVGGNPSRLIRYRFSSNEISKLMSSEWWNWPIEKIKDRANNFMNIKKFLTSIE